ncbi:hypothetical protein MGYG_08990 [Nannizzia gypsea CBS 118893]|uniref:Uncharacterized protein n=1 Tax=Arthroderma gypseum (strain ATCC MYA-4604 / CBS 118893) TaxID=535722 RepID=E4UNI6_ARTGP|nr:hypothetical protein MGYG_08990 [Nannizzia gypsea CBS 118893]EFQ99594.1 hypothetical protein MGYG_08990 [Nannizzia gypsea CBS 118893]
MDERLPMDITVENARRVKNWLGSLPVSPVTTSYGSSTSSDFAKADLMDLCQHPDCAFQVRLISVHDHKHHDELPLDQLYPTHCDELSGSTGTETTFWTAQSHQEASDDGYTEVEEPGQPGEPKIIENLEEIESLEELERLEEPEEPEEPNELNPEETGLVDKKLKKAKRTEKPRQKPESRHTPFEINLYQASWFHKLDMSEDGSSLAEEDLDFLASKPFEASTRQQLRRSVRQAFKKTSIPIRQKLGQWKKAILKWLGER